MNAVLIGIYVVGIVAANVLVTAFGQPALPFTAFFLIPMDLVVRDLLQDRFQNDRSKLFPRMIALILIGSVISYITTVGSLRIATASLAAFLFTGLFDMVTYQTMIRWGRIARINLATIIAAFTDSIIFAVIAFDHIENNLVIMQAVTKIAGGFVWSLVLFRFFKSPK